MPRSSKPQIKLLRKRLDELGVRAHFDALAGQASAVEIRVKGAATDHSSLASTELADAARSLVAGEIVAVQIRFHQDGAWWCDTVMRAGDGFRLVRMHQG